MSVLAVHFSSTLLKWISQPSFHSPLAHGMDWSWGAQMGFFLGQLKWKLPSRISPSELQLWMGAQFSPQDANAVNMGSSAPVVSLCGTTLPCCTAVAADKGRALESLLSLLSEHCPAGAEEWWPAEILNPCCSREPRCFSPAEHLSLTLA